MCTQLLLSGYTAGWVRATYKVWVSSHRGGCRASSQVHGRLGATRPVRGASQASGRQGAAECRGRARRGRARWGQAGGTNWGGSTLNRVSSHGVAIRVESMLLRQRLLV